MPNISKIKDADTNIVYDIEDTVARNMAGGLSSAVKTALLACFQNVAWINDDGQTYYDALYDALYPPVNLASISAVYTQSGTIYDTDLLDSLKTDLVVTAHYTNGTSGTVSDYTLSGILTEGTSVITVAYGDKVTSFNVNVVGNQPVWHRGVGFNVSGANQITNSDAITGTTNVRAVYVCDNGNIPSFRWIRNGDTSQESGYYPIPIPNGAIGVRFASNSNSVYATANTVHYVNDFWYSIASTGWKNSSYTFNFDANATHWVLAVKNGSAGTSDVTQAICNNVTVEYIYE